MATVKAKDLVKLLEKNGFREVRIKGQHHQFKKDGHPKVATVSYARAKDPIPSGTVQQILRGADLEEEAHNLFSRPAKKTKIAKSADEPLKEIKLDVACG